MTVRSTEAKNVSNSSETLKMTVKCSTYFKRDPSAMQKIVIVGATSAIAEHCARLWLENSAVDLTLIGRNTSKIEKIAADLKIRSPNSIIRTLITSFQDPKAISEIIANIQPIDIALIAHGTLPLQADCQQDLTLCEETLLINGISPVLFAEAFANHMQQANHGTLAIIGSVAGDRGRKTNYIYGAAKAMIEHYVQGLQHRLAKTPVKVILIKPGPTDTPMTSHFKQKGLRMAPVTVVAKDIVKGINQGKPVIYTPGKWALIMFVIRHLPRFIFAKLEI